MSALVERIIFARDNLNGLNISDYGIIRQARHVLADAANYITEMEKDLHAYRETMRVISEGEATAPLGIGSSRNRSEAECEATTNHPASLEQSSEDGQAS